MGFTRSERDVKIIQKLSDYPNAEDGMSAEQLKENFDKGSLILQEDLNKLQEELEENKSAGFLGAQYLDDTDESSNNVQAKLEYLLNQIKGVSQGQVPDGSITEKKLDPSYSNSVAKKDGTLQKGLNAEKIGGILVSEIFSVGNYTGTYKLQTSGSIETQTITLGFRPRFLVIVCERKFAMLINGIGIYNSGSSSTANVEITAEYAEVLDNGFNVSGSSLNAKDDVFTYIAFR